MEKDFSRLEIKLKSLIEQFEHLKKFNNTLSHGTSTLNRERNLLLERQKQAVSQISSLVTKLKTLEK